MISEGKMSLKSLTFIISKYMCNVSLKLILNMNKTSTALSLPYLLDPVVEMKLSPLRKPITNEKIEIFNYAAKKSL